MQRCSEKAYSRCPNRDVCPIDDAVFEDYSYCAEFNQRVEVEPITNADRIRAMSDDELAKFLCKFRSLESSGYACYRCVAVKFCRSGHTGMIDWLQQPAEEWKE